MPLNKGIGSKSKRRILSTQSFNCNAMTVCIAAICDDGRSIVGLADEMMVTNSMTAESPSKLIPIAHPHVALIAGDLLLQTEIIQKVTEKTGKYDSGNEDEYYKWKAKEIADLFADAYTEIRQKRIEKQILEFYLLSAETWQTQQNTLSAETVQTIQNEIQDFRMPNVATIIAGVDDFDPYADCGSGFAHLYVIENDMVNCRDLLGYACIGEGGTLADSEFIFRRYKPTVPITHSAYITYCAKRRSEVIATVGKETLTLFIVDSGKNLVKAGIFYGKEFSNLLQKIYKQRADAARLHDLHAFTKITKFVKEKLENEQAKTETKQVAAGQDKARKARPSSKPKRLQSRARKG